MERFDVKRGLMKQILADGGLAVLAKKYFDKVEADGKTSFAQDSRRKWTLFLDEATGYNSKQRGDKAKEWGKKASKAKSAVNAARHYMKLSSNVSEEVKTQAESLIEEIESALKQGENTKAAGRGEKLNKLFK
jgi:hypothetical protein